ncbi:MAG TPA: Ig-like domain-containing protein [Saprospiraceae bacterium]|nr:Ig-like domain-containing protein [Saprospiraceae bacterium]
MSEEKATDRRCWTDFLWVILSLSSLFLLDACANPTAPTGGPRDERPPQIDSTRSTPNFQTNFDQSYFELTFDEWVVLEDVREQVVVSPPLDFEVKLKKKTVRFEVREGDSLRANTTYTVNFGEAVQDLTEGNPAENLRFVFSTGDVLDSLRLTGQLYDVVTREAMENTYFMLYDNLSDTVVTTERPYYFGRTDEFGQFTIENLRAGTFKGFALKAGAVSGYLYTNSGEQIGFPDTLLEIRPGEQPGLELAMFVEEKPLRFFNTIPDQYGQSKLLFNQSPPEDLELRRPDSLSFSYFNSETSRDTLIIWYDLPASQPWSLILARDTSLLDTANTPALDKDAFLANSRLRRKGGNSTATKKLAPGAAIPLEWNHPLATIDTSRIALYKDSIRVYLRSAEVDSLAFREMQIAAPFQQDSVYQLLIFPGAVSDIYGISNQDTVEANYRIGILEDYGNLIINVTDLDSTLHYRGELRQGDQLLDTFYIAEQSDFRYEKRTLQPQKYTIRLIEDRNQNRKWDTGDYLNRRQPEPIYTKELEQLRANWDLDETIRLSDLKRIVVPESNTSGNR